MSVKNVLLHLALSLASLLSIALTARLSIPTVMITAGGFMAAACILGLRRPTQGAAMIRLVTAIVLLLLLGVICTSIWRALEKQAPLSLASHVVTMVLAAGLCWNLAFIKTTTVSPRSELRSVEAATATFGTPSLVLTLCTACLLTALLLLLTFMVSVRFESFAEYAEKLLERGSIPPLTLLIFCWGALILFAKGYAILGARQAFVQLSGGGLRPPSPLIDELSLILNDRPADTRGEEREEVEERLTKYFAFVWQVREDSYIFPKYSIWAVPILGFLGTVVGISMAVQAIGAVMSSPDNTANMSSRIGAAIDPLAVAFDTTLISLTLSLLLVLMQAAVQRWEVDLLTLFELLARPIKAKRMERE